MARKKYHDTVEVLGLISINLRKHEKYQYVKLDKTNKKTVLIMKKDGITYEISAVAYEDKQ